MSLVAVLNDLTPDMLKVLIKDLSECEYVYFHEVYNGILRVKLYDDYLFNFLDLIKDFTGCNKFILEVENYNIITINLGG